MQHQFITKKTCQGTLHKESPTELFEQTLGNTGKNVEMEQKVNCWQTTKLKENSNRNESYT